MTLKTRKIQHLLLPPTQVANDPVNAKLSPYVGQHGSSLQHTSFTGDFWLDYPNPLPPNDYPVFSSGSQYQGGELFLTFARTQNLLDPALTEVKKLKALSLFHRWVMLAAGLGLDHTCPGWRWVHLRAAWSTLPPFLNSPMWKNCPASCWTGW